MKKLFYIISLIAVAAITAVSCQQKEEPHEKGPADVPGCYGVFFPSQAASGSHIYNPTQDKSVDITLKRTNTSGSITVPVKATFSEDGIFSMGEASFADGQDETKFTVRFDGAKEGVTYNASFEIDDNNYASLYKSNPIALDFSFMCVEMQDFKNPVTGEPAVITLNQGWWGETHMAKMEYYEVDGIRYCTIYSIEEGNGIWGDDVNATLQFNWYTNNKNGDGNCLLEVPKQYFGFDYSDWGSKPEGDAVNPIYVYDYYSYWIERGESEATIGKFLDFAKNYGEPTGSYPISYYDGKGGFYFNLRYYIPGLGGFSPNPYEFVAIAEGFTRVDYRIKVNQAGVSEEGEVPVTFTLGPDVDKVVYSFAEGTLTATQIGNVAASLSYNSEDAITEGSGTYYFELAKTGVYTLVAATYDEKGNQQEVANCEIIYLAAADADEYAVVIDGGIGSAAKYAPSGVNTDNSLEIYVYGKDIKDAKLAVFSRADLAGNYDGCVEKLMGTKSVSAAAIEAINGTGYVDVVSGLLPGTEYYLFVYASNGYAETALLFGSEYTTGEPLLIYRNFSVYDYDPEFGVEDKSGLFGTWNYYGIDLDESLGLREYLGKVVISDSETEDAPFEEEGQVYYDQYVYLKGLSAGSIAAAKSYGLVDTDDDTVEFSFDTYSQVLYVNSYWAVGFDSNSYADGPFYFTQYASGLGGWYRATGFMAAIPVADGYFAFVDVSNQGYDFNAWRFMCGGYRWLSVQDPLLVDPAKDDSGLAKSIDASVARAKQLVRESAKEIDNCVMTEKGRIHALLQKYNEKQTSVKAYDTMLGVKGGEIPVHMVKPVSVKHGETKAVAPASHVLEKTAEVFLR